MQLLPGKIGWALYMTDAVGFCGLVFFVVVVWFFLIFLLCYDLKAWHEKWHRNLNGAA